MKRHRRGCEIWRSRDKKALASARRKATNLKRYGVEDASQTAEARARRAATNKVRYGAENVFCRESGVFDKVQASLEGKRFRPDVSPFADPEVQAKSRLTVRERYGVENVQQVPEIRARTEATMRERYGGSLMASAKLAAKARATNEARYGDACPQRTDEVKERQRQTNLERWGVEWTGQHPEVRARQLATHHERYGSHWFASDEGKEVVRAAMLERYGVDHPAKMEGFWEKVVMTFRERYGVDHPLQDPEFQAKQRATNIERHGWDYYINSVEFVRSCFIGAGVPLPEVLPYHPMKNREYARKHLERMGAGIPGPNGLESKVLNLAPPGSLTFTGDRKWWRWLPLLGRHKNPDFIVPGPDPDHPFRGVTKAIEAFGDFWHSRMFTGKAPFAHESELVAAYAEIGIACLVVWESEVKTDPEGVRSRLSEFLSG